MGHAKTNSIWFIYFSGKILAKYIFCLENTWTWDFRFDEKGYVNQRQFFSIPGPNLMMRMTPGLP
jgi:hypothetical protein